MDATVWSGNLQARIACGGDATPIGESWQGCVSYREDTYFSLNSPQQNYWVIHANNDPAFDQCRKGPPSVSEIIIDPIASPTTPNLYKIAVEPLPTGLNALNIIVAPWEHDFTCTGYVHPITGGNKQMTIPYLSVGAHSNRGNGQAIGYVSRRGGNGSDVLKFRARIRGRGDVSCRGDQDDPCDSAWVGAHAGVLLTAQWAGRRRMLFLDLYNEGMLLNAAPARSHWSWPIEESMFWPGGEVVNLSGDQVARLCTGTSSITMLEVGTPGPVQSYELPMSQLFMCAEHLNLWTDPLPDEYVEVEGVDWFVEISATSGMLWLEIQAPVIAGR